MADDSDGQIEARTNSHIRRSPLVGIPAGGLALCLVILLRQTVIEGHYRRAWRLRRG